MPHLTLDYTANLDAAGADMRALCTTLAATLVALRNEAGGPLFPVAGTRVMARPAAVFAVADGEPGRAFIYLNLLIDAGRSDAMKQRAGEAVLAAASAHLDGLFADHAIGMTVHVVEATPAWTGKRNNLASHLEKAAS